MEQGDPSALAVLLRRFRTAADLTQEELSELARVSARTVSDIERGIARRPQAHTALQLADALGLDGDDRIRFLDAARGRQAVPAARDADLAPMQIGVPAASSGSVTETARPGESRNGILPFPGTLPIRPRPASLSGRKPGTRAAALAVVAALLLAAGLIAALRAPGGKSSAPISTAARPAVLDTLGTHFTGPFPLHHMWNIAVLPNGRIAVTTYNGEDDFPIEKGVDELSPTGRLLWSWAIKTRRQAGLSGLAGDAAGNLYLAARYFKQIYKFSPDGTLLAQMGTNLEGPTRVAVDSRGTIWVLDFDASHLVHLSSTGKLLGSFGSAGGGYGQLKDPDALAIGPSGHLYVAEWGKGHITEYSTGGKPIRVWGSKGSLPGQVQNPRGLAIDSSGNIYVADTDNDRVEKFTASGRLLAVWARRGYAPGSFTYPVGVAVAPDGKVYVADDGNSHYCSCGVDRIEIFSPSGRFLSQISASVLTHPETLSSVSNLAVDSRGDVYASDTGTDRIVAFGPSHLPLSGWDKQVGTVARISTPAGLAVAGNGDILAADYFNGHVVQFSPRGTFIRQFGSDGGAAGGFSYPEGIAVDAAGDVFVADTYDQRVDEFSIRGKFLRSWDVMFSLSNAGFSPSNAGNRGAIAVDRSGNVYTGNEISMTVDKFSPTGSYLASLGGPGTNSGSFRSISSIAVDRHGRVYVADSVSRAVTVFSPSGTRIARWTASRFPALGTPRAIALDRAGHLYVGGGRQIVELAPLS